MATAPPPYYQDNPPVDYAPPHPPNYPAQPYYAPQPQAIPNYGAYQPVGQPVTQHSTHNTTVVVGQPTAPTVTLVQRKPDNYVVLSVFTLLCCCWLFGIVALIYAMQVDSAYASGDVVSAQSASRSARTWNIVGIIFGCVAIAIAIVISIISTAVSVASANEPDY